MKRKKMFGVIPYLETEQGDRLTRESAVWTVRVGMGVGALAVTLIISQLYPFVAQEFGGNIGLGFIVAMVFSWTLSSYLAYDKAIQKVIEIYKDKGEYYEQDD